MKLGARQLMLVRMLPLCMASLLLWPSIRHAVDARMSLVMLLEFPILLTCGWTLGNMLPAQLSSRLGRLNAMGLSAMTALLMVFSYWMIPAALDEALLTPAAYSARHFSWLAAGALLALPRPECTPGVQVFFLGNLAWMAASAGMLYRESETRLCVNYLLQDQLLAGDGLIAAALLMFGAVIWIAYRGLLHPAAASPRTTQTQ